MKGGRPSRRMTVRDIEMLALYEERRGQGSPASQATESLAEQFGLSPARIQTALSAERRRTALRREALECADRVAARLAALRALRA